MTIKLVKTTYQTLRRRLKRAFAAINKIQGMAARQKYLCCGNCATHAAAEEFKHKRLFIYYHEQDDDSIPACNHVYIGYFSPNDELDDKGVIKAMKEEVIPTLNQHGIYVEEWNGSVAKRPRLVAKRRVKEAEQ